MATATTTRRSRRPAPSPARTLVLALAALGFLAVLLGIAARAPDGVPLRDYRTVHATVPNVGNLRVHNEVRIAGLVVGQVREITTDGDGAQLALQLEPDTGALPADTAIRIRGRGLLGARYVELVPGTSPRDLAGDAVIRGGDDAFAYGVPEVLDTFDTETRGALSQALGGLGAGLLGRGDGLNEALRRAPGGIQDFRDLAAAIRARPGAAERLLPSVASGMGALSAARDELLAALPPLRRALGQIARRRDEVSATLRAAPDALADGTRGLRAGQALLRSARELSVVASAALPPAPGGLRAAAALLNESDRPLDRATSLLREGTGAVPALRSVLGAARPVVRPLGQTLSELLEPVRLAGRHGCDLENFGDNWRSFLGYGIPGGAKIGPLHSIRIEVIAGPESLGGSGEQLKTDLVRRDPYPQPCTYSPGPTYEPLSLTATPRGTR